MSASQADRGIVVAKAQNGLRKRDVERILNILLKKERGLCALVSAPMQGAGQHSDHCDQADGNAFLHKEVSLRNYNLSVLKKVREAISRIADGTFGVCLGPDKFNTENESCNGKIDLRRLLSSPLAEICTDCMKERNVKDELTSSRNERSGI